MPYWWYNIKEPRHSETISHQKSAASIVARIHVPGIVWSSPLVVLVLSSSRIFFLLFAHPF